MKVKELIEELEQYDGDAEVIANDGKHRLMFNIHNTKVVRELPIVVLKIGDMWAQEVNVSF